MLFSWGVYSAPSGAATLNVAVASNFSPTFQTIKTEFEAQSDHRLVEINGSSGKLFAQIYHGAPIDLFLAADSERPHKLVQMNIAAEESRFTYAIGQIALWHSKSAAPPSIEILASGNYRRLAIANPRIAPYGKAAMEVIMQLNVAKAVLPKLVRGENVSQALHYVDSGNAALGFVALSQVLGKHGSYWLVPPSLHQPIEQQAVIVRQSQAANEFSGFLKSPQGRKIIVQSGYLAP